MQPRPWETFEVALPSRGGLGGSRLLSRLLLVLLARKPGPESGLLWPGVGWWGPLSI